MKTMNTMKKIAALVSAAVTLMTVIPMNALALTEQEKESARATMIKQFAKGESVFAFDEQYDFDFQSREEMMGVFKDVITRTPEALLVDAHPFELVGKDKMNGMAISYYVDSKSYNLELRRMKTKFWNIYDTCPADATDYEKVEYFHDYMISNYTYDFAAIPYNENSVTRFSYSPYGLLKRGMGVCAGYAELYTMFMTACGIESHVVESYQLNHEWNIVKLDGDWYYVDVTWDGNVSYLHGRDSKTFFLKTEEEFLADGHGAGDWTLKNGTDAFSLPKAKTAYVVPVEETETEGITETSETATEEAETEPTTAETVVFTEESSETETTVAMTDTTESDTVETAILSTETEDTVTTETTEIAESTSEETTVATETTTTVMTETTTTTVTDVTEAETTETEESTEPATETPSGIGILTNPGISAVKGDVDGDGEVSVLDIIRVNRYILGVGTLTAGEFKRADLYEDGIIDIFDLGLLKMLFLA